VYGKFMAMVTSSAHPRDAGNAAAETSEVSAQRLQLTEIALQRNTRRAQRARRARDEAAASGTLVWDPFDPAWRTDPDRVYARLRENNPAHWSPLGFGVFTRHADCLPILRDRRWSSDSRNADAAQRPGLQDTGLVEGNALSEMLAEMAPFLFRDPPDHTRLRRLVQQVFTPRVVQDLRPRIEQICAELLDEALEHEVTDLVAGYAYPLPVQIITEILGVPPQDQAQFRGWSGALARGLDPEFLLPADAVEQRLAGALSFIQYFAGLINQRRVRPGDDLISRLIQARDHDDALTEGELIATCILLLVAGHETTVSLISGGALALMEHPDQLARFRDDPAVLRSGIEEMLRFVSPVQLTSRIALEDMEVAGITVRTGDYAMLLIGSANRDPAVFSKPGTFDVGRADNPHLGFGYGIHNCLGAPLAKLEAQIALSALLRRARRLKRTSEPLAYKQSIALRGLATLPVALSAR
jgi:cytochrome P450